MISNHLMTNVSATKDGNTPPNPLWLRCLGHQVGNWPPPSPLITSGVPLLCIATCPADPWSTQISVFQRKPLTNQDFSESIISTRARARGGKRSGRSVGRRFHGPPPPAGRRSHGSGTEQAGNGAGSGGGGSNGEVRRTVPGRCCVARLWFTISFSLLLLLLAVADRPAAGLLLRFDLASAAPAFCCPIVHPRVASLT